MTETAKQAVARCQGTVHVLLATGYSSDASARWAVSKPQARKIIDMAPSKSKQPTPVWNGDDLLLRPNAT